MQKTTSEKSIRTDNMDCKTSIVILNWNGSNMLKKFLPSVLACSANAEVVVADNASTDGSLDLLRSSFPEVRLIVLDRNYGFAEGYNKALEQVKAQYYVLLNSDWRWEKDGCNPLWPSSTNMPVTEIGRASCRERV